MAKSKLKKVNDYELRGYVVNDRTRRRPHQLKLYFYIKLDSEIETMDGWKGLQALSDKKRVKGMNPGAILTFTEESGSLIVMIWFRVGSSFSILLHPQA